MSDRARQFLPFNSLRGFQAEIKKREQIIVEKKELISDKKESLSYKISQIRIGQMLTVIYYDNNNYFEVTGIVTSLNFETQYLTIVKKKIAFFDIYDISGDEIKEDF